MHNLPLWVDVLVSALVLIGTGFAVVGSWGLAKLSDFFKRLHGPTKASTLGVGCVLIASILYFTVGRADHGISVHELVITLFVFLTAPISAHLLSRAALRLRPQARPSLPPPEHERRDQH